MRRLHIAVIIILLGLAWGCRWTTLPEPPPSAHKPPSYPAAQNEKAIFPNNDSSVQIVTFQTADKPDVVLDFYRNTLQADGWEYGPVLSSDSSAFFTWPVQPRRGVTSYEMRVTTSEATPGLTSVEIKVAEFLPE